LDTALDFVYFYSIAFPVLAGGALYYSVRLTRIAGSFRGWILIITFLVVFAFQALSSLLGVVAIFNPNLVEQYLQKNPSFVGTGAYNTVLAAILFAAMSSIYRTFRGLQARTERPQAHAVPA
jgi:hypothetical protein